MSATPPTTREDAATEPSSWRPLIAMILTAIGVYAVLAVVLILEATAGGVHGLVWLVVPGVLFLAAAVSLFASLTPVRRRLAAFRTWSLEAGPSERSAHRPVVSLREHV
jgi:hypothetical protein